MGKSYKTEGRKKIMDILRQSGGVPLSVPQIEGKLQEGGSPLNKTTIYRYLDKLEELLKDAIAIHDIVRKQL